MPSTYLYVRSIIREKPEPEIDLLPYLCDFNKISIDVGAAGGMYTYKMQKFSQSCISFEPRPTAFLYLEKIFRNYNKKVITHNLALSDSNGSTIMQVHNDEPGLSTIEKSNHLGDNNYTNFNVVTKKLDSFKFTGVSFVKIDVEGHELSVLSGAKNLISKERPNLIIEIEERHKEGSISEVFNFLRKLEYKGFFLHSKELIPINDLNPDLNSNLYNKTGSYINNFIFISNKNIDHIKSLLTSSEIIFKS